MEYYARVRHAYFNDKKSQREIATLFSLNRRTVQKMIESAEPISQKRSIDSSSLKLAPYREWIDEILSMDEKVHKKQRHSALRIFKRLREEKSFTGGYTIVREYISEKRLKCKEMYVPLLHEPGSAEFDFGEAYGIIGGKRTLFHYGVMQLPMSGAFFLKAYPAENTETFCDCHSSAFEYFGGVPTSILYDNTKIAVIKILKRGKRDLTEGFLRLKSHYLFSSIFANPASGNEKGSVENTVGYARRNFMVPEPNFETFDQFNAYLRESCKASEKNIQNGYTKSIKERFQEETLLPFPNVDYIPFRFQAGVISREGLVRFQNNDYSVPINLGPQKVFIKGFVQRVQIIYKDKVIADHERLYEKGGVQFNPLHYLPLLERKTRAFHQAAPLKNWILPDVFERVHQRLLLKDPLNGTRLYIGILRLLECFHVNEVASALLQAIQLDCVDVSAIRHLLGRLLEGKHPDLSLLNHPHIPRVNVENTNLNAYAAMV